MINSEPIDTQIVRVSESVGLRIFGWAGFLLLLVVSIWTWRVNEKEVSVGFAAFSLLPLWMALGLGWVEISTEKIVRGCTLATYEIYWKEIETIKSDGLTFLFYGTDKRFPLVPSYLIGPNKQQAFQWLESEIKRRQLPIKYDRFASYKFPKNTRV